MENKADDNLVAVIPADGKTRREELEIYWSDVWFIEYIRKVGFAKLSEVEIQNGRIVMVKKCEEKIKPRRPSHVDEKKD